MRTINTPANQLRIFVNNLKLVGVSLGKCFLPILQVVLPVLNKLMSALTSVLQVVANFMYALLGVKMTISGAGDATQAFADDIGDVGDAASDIGDVGNAAGGLGKDLDNATGKAKKLQSVLMGFDEIHTLNMPDTDSGSGSSGSGGSGSGGSGGGGSIGGGGSTPTITPHVDVVQTETAFSKLADKIKAWIKTINFEPLKKSFQNLKDSIMPVIETIGKGIEWFVENILAPFAKWSIENGLPAFFDLLAAAFKALNPFLKGVGKGLKALWDDFLVHIANFAGDAFIDFMKFLTKALEDIGKWLDEHQDTVAWFTEFIGVIMLVAGAIKLVIGIVTGISALVPIVAGVVGAIVAIVTAPITWVILAIATVVFVIVKYRDQIVAAIKAAVDWIINFFTILGNACVDIFWDVVHWFEQIGQDIMDIFHDVCDWIGNVFKKAADAIKNAWSVVCNFFQGIWDGIKNIFSVVGNWFSNVFTSAVNGIKNAFSVVGNFFKNVWTSITNIFANIGNWFGEKFRQAANGIRNAFSGIGSFFSNVFSNIVDIFRNVGTRVGSAISGAVRAAINGVLSGACNIINGFIRMINGVVWLINKIPGVNIGTVGYLSVPRLAKGGIVDKSTLANIGENGKEAVVPLENNTEWMDKLADKINKNNDTPVNITLKVGDQTLGNVVINSLKDLQKTTGNSIFTMV